MAEFLDPGGLVVAYQAKVRLKNLHSVIKIIITLAHDTSP